MTRCEQCSKAFEDLAFSCNQCGGRYCAAHRLPERHGCTHDEILVKTTSGSDTYETVEVAANRKPSGSGSSRGSPDMNPDGTLDAETVEMLENLEPKEKEPLQITPSINWGRQKYRYRRLKRRVRLFILKLPYSVVLVASLGLGLLVGLYVL